MLCGGVEQFKINLYGRQVELCTDHNPLVWLRSCREPIGRLMRWILTLVEYNYQMCYRPGKSIPHLDALSRAPLRAAVTRLNNTSIKEGGLRLECPRNASKTIQHYLRQRDRLFRDEEGVLCVRAGKHRGNLQVIVPTRQVSG